MGTSFRDAMLFSLAAALRPSTASGPAARTASAHGGWFARDESIMGTAIRVELWCDDREAGQAALDAVMREMHRIDRAMSPYKPDSELSRLNRGAALAPVVVSAELFDLVARSIAFSRLSDGAFDITYAAIGHLYDYRRRVRPSDEAIADARAAVGYQHLVLDERARTVGFAREGVRIDLGGFAKGHAVERGVAILARRGIENAIVTAGGDSRLLGDRRGRPWNIAVRDPRRAGEVVALLPLEDVAISTSGDYERFFDEGGVRHHHVIDPRTGRSPRDVHSVTIVAADGLTSEALSKTVFVLGVERGLALIDRLPGVDAVVIDAASALHYSSGLLAGTAPARP
jgi:thiamine biosynthesis lipoprotein